MPPEHLVIAPRPVEAVRSRPDGERPEAPRPESAPSWEEIAERYGDTVYTMAYRLTGDRDEARDLAQDVFVRVYRNLDRYRPGTFEGWLYRITRNLFLDRMRRRRRVRIEPLPEEEWRQPSEEEPGPAERAEAGVLRGDLEDSLGWPIGTVRSRIHRGRKALRTSLEGGPPRG